MRACRSAVALLFVLGCGGNARAQNAGALIGLWGNETIFGPEVRGPFTLVRDAAGWVARVDGYEVPARVWGDSVRARLPGGQGELRGAFSPDRRHVLAFWIQPPGVWLGNAYASPVRLERQGAAEWRGDMLPLDDRLSVYLMVRRAADGSLLGVFRNPEAGLTGGTPAFHVMREGEHVHFVGASRGTSSFTARYDPLQHQLTVPWAAVGRPLVLTRRDSDQAVGFYPRITRARPYTYRVPLDRGDGWSTAPAHTVGVNEDSLTTLVRRILAADPVGDSTNLVHAVLVARHGKLVLEEYFFGYDADRPHDLRSASKPVASLLLGVARDHGAAIGPETPVASLFGGQFAHPNANKGKITLADLLTHSSGLACDDNDGASPGNENTMQARRDLDWYRFVLDLPDTYPPGKHWAYCSAGINLVGGAVRQTVHDWLPAYFERYVASVLGIAHYYVQLMPDTGAYLGGGMYLRPRDFLKLGQAYLDGGVWRGRRLVSRRWVERSTTGAIAGRDGDHEGLAWHVYTIHAASGDYHEIEANGTGGQILMVMPSLDLTVLFTAGNYNSYLISRRSRDELVPQLLIPAVQP